MDGDIKKILQQSDKAEIIEWLNENMVEADKCLIITARKAATGGLDIDASQMGFDYLYEIDGFLEYFQTNSIDKFGVDNAG